MTDALQPTKTLEERITARLHDSIGDLITDDDLKGMVARGIEKALFVERLDEKNSDQWHKRMKPSVVDEQVAKLLSEKMTVAVREWLEQNPAKLEAAILEVMRAGVADAVTRTMESRLAGIFPHIIDNMKHQGLIGRGPNG